MVFAKIDSNQKRIVEEIRKIGASVFSLAAVKKGFPDIIVGYRGNNYLFEIKDGSKPVSKRKLTPIQVVMHANWKGQVNVVTGSEEIIKIISKNP